jgi:ArsR family transcriptional regulator
MDDKSTVTSLAALAQPLRLAAFRLLVRAGPAGMAASKIAESLAISPSALSFHLKELSHAYLLASRHEGRFVIYSANFETMRGLIGFLTDNCCGGEPCAVTTACSD